MAEQRHRNGLADAALLADAEDQDASGQGEEMQEMFFPEDNDDEESGSAADHELQNDRQRKDVSHLRVKSRMIMPSDGIDGAEDEMHDQNDIGSDKEQEVSNASEDDTLYESASETAVANAKTREESRKHIGRPNDVYVNGSGTIASSPILSSPSLSPDPANGIRSPSQ